MKDQISFWKVVFTTIVLGVLIVYFAVSESDLTTKPALAQLSSSQKFCSVYNPNSASDQGNGPNGPRPAWRDTFSVPPGWTASKCSTFANQVNANKWQIGCFSNAGYTFGSPMGGLPTDNNCGWKTSQ